MDELPELRHLYKSFRKLADEAGSFFRQKDHYSLIEQINFILTLHRSFVALELFFENDEELKNGSSITISGSADFSKVTLDYKHLVDEFETVISVIYFNLNKDDIDGMVSYCKSKSMPGETLILKRLFDKFLQ